jgi:hypothetical protein
MKRIIYALISACTLASCAESYSVQGSSSVSALDGSKLYLKAIKDNELKSIDSCEVVHGQFRFAGLLDTVRMANLFMDDESIMPIVLEKGEIGIKIDNASQTVFGTPLNEKLYEFIDFHNQLDNQMNELSHKQSQMLLDGIDEEVIDYQLSTEAAEIARREDSLVTNFIVDNFDNVLGPGIFMMITSTYRYPVLTPQIEDIMSNATPKFKSDPYVRDYYQVATENQARQTGLSDAGQLPPPDVAQSQDSLLLNDSLQPASQPHLSVQPQVPITNLPGTDEKAD